MKTTMVRYRTTEAYGDANEAAIRAVFARGSVAGAAGPSLRLPPAARPGDLRPLATFETPVAEGRPIR